MIRKQVYNSSTLQTTTDYIDGFVYITQGTGSPLISYFPMPEGRVLNTSSSGVTLVKEFIVTDQQGNARVSFRDGGSGTPVVYQENSYYGFGLVLPNSPVGTIATSNKQLYNGGSEWQNDYSNLPDYYQTYYRNYDAALARWVGVDPMAEASCSISVYHYSGNNPIMYNDPLGDKIDPDKVLRPTQGNATENVNMQYVGGLQNGAYQHFLQDMNNWNEACAIADGVPAGTNNLSSIYDQLSDQDYHNRIGMGDVYNELHPSDITGRRYITYWADYHSGDGDILDGGEVTIGSRKVRVYYNGLNDENSSANQGGPGARETPGMTVYFMDGGNSPLSVVSDYGPL